MAAYGPPAALTKFWRILAYARNQWPVLAAILALTSLYSALAAFQPLPIKLLVDHGLGNAPLLPVISRWLSHTGLSPEVACIALAAALSIIVFALSAILDAALMLLWAVGGQRMVYALATELFLRLQRLSLIFHSRRSVGDSLAGRRQQG